ncbi:hypothetical protein RRG08_005472 [Elysia crispata]|uniref:Uncharacterized protein n=1 Tax=Elysia crispata TaxID=231223 RepID=A0AAE1CQM7_9GAST|nr:hypothetical protein RRG08_005472 [Elysia crispata]
MQSEAAMYVFLKRIICLEEPRNCVEIGISRKDMEMVLNKVVPEPAHAKAAMMGSNLSIPITNGKFNLGTWQGIWLCEHRDSGGSRKLVVTMNGLKK